MNTPLLSGDPDDPDDRILKTLRTRRQGPVLTIELNVPEQGNVVSEAMLDDLLSVLDDQDPSVRVLVLTGAARTSASAGTAKSSPSTSPRMPPATASASPASRAGGCATR